MRIAIASAWVSVSLLSLAACRTDVPVSDASNLAPTASATTASSASPPAATDADAGATTSSTTDDDRRPAAEFLKCATDDDCIAVPRNGCCKLGWKEAVAKTSADAYAKSFTCDRPHPICPMIRVRDTRTVSCVQGTCTMMKSQ